MTKNESSLWSDQFTRQLAEVLVAIDSKQTMQNVLRDVMTEKEILEISARLEAARMLNEGETYVEISKKTKLSSRTIARISDWMQNGQGGYKSALAIISEHHDHLPPAHAE